MTAEQDKMGLDRGDKVETRMEREQLHDRESNVMITEPILPEEEEGTKAHPSFTLPSKLNIEPAWEGGGQEAGGGKRRGQ